MEIQRSILFYMKSLNIVRDARCYQNYMLRIETGKWRANRKYLETNLLILFSTLKAALHRGDLTQSEKDLCFVGTSIMCVQLQYRLEHHLIRIGNLSI